MYCRGHGVSVRRYANAGLMLGRRPSIKPTLAQRLPPSPANNIDERRQGQAGINLTDNPILSLPSSSTSRLIPDQQEMMAQCWANAGPASATLTQH